MPQRSCKITGILRKVQEEKDIMRTKIQWRNNKYNEGNYKQDEERLHWSLEMLFLQHNTFSRSYKCQRDHSRHYTVCNLHEQVCARKSCSYITTIRSVLFLLDRLFRVEENKWYSNLEISDSTEANLRCAPVKSYHLRIIIKLLCPSPQETCWAVPLLSQ